jgi:hypothetical protein
MDWGESLNGCLERGGNEKETERNDMRFVKRIEIPMILSYTDSIKETGSLSPPKVYLID